MFYSVNLQPEDSERDLKTLGLRLKTRKKQTFLPQPCPAHRDSTCSIYEHRPQRCRLFNCKQLLRAEAGQIAEAEAMATIHQAKALANSVLNLLLQSGSTNLRRSLRTRYELALAQPLDPETDAYAAGIRFRLIQDMEKLETLLASDFRV
jgi:hypothetical protein